HLPDPRGQRQVHVGARITVWYREHIQGVHLFLILLEETGTSVNHSMKAGRINLLCQTRSPSILIHQAYALNINVHFVHRQAHQLVQGVLYFGLYIVCHFGDLGAVTDDDVEVDHQLPVFRVNLDTLVQIFPSQQIGDSVLQLAAGCHSHQPVTVHGGSTCNGTDHLFRHIDLAEGGGQFQRHRNPSLDW